MEIEVLQNTRFAKMANLRSELKAVEDSAFVSYNNPGLHESRETVLNTVEQCRRTRFKLGQALNGYRRHFRAEQVWMQAVKVIAEAISCSERTVHRIFSDYEHAAKLPPITLDAMMEQKIDPAAGKNASLVDELFQIPEPRTSEEAATTVTKAHQQHVVHKKQEKSTGKKTERATLEEFNARIVKQFKDRYRSVPPDIRDGEVRYVLEQIVNTFHIDIGPLRQFGRPSLVPKPEVNAAA